MVVNCKNHEYRHTGPKKWQTYFLKVYYVVSFPPFQSYFVIKQSFFLSKNCFHNYLSKSMNVRNIILQR